MGEHFCYVGSHANANVALFAIDSLRQLADKFLLKEEYASMNFQKHFLKPFETIMLNNLHTRSDIKEFIVMCVTRICQSKTSHIHSAWSVIINIFTLAAQDTEGMLVTQTFQALQSVVKNHFELLESDFVELVNCITKYANNGLFPAQAVLAQELLCVCAEKLQTGRIVATFVQKCGKAFFNSDQENMVSYPL